MGEGARKYEERIVYWTRKAQENPKRMPGECKRELQGTHKGLLERNRCGPHTESTKAVHNLLHYQTIAKRTER